MRTAVVFILAFTTRLAAKHYLIETGKQPPPKFEKPICIKPPCLMKKIRVKVYIEDSLWNMMSEDGSDPSEDIIGRMEELFEEINKHLNNLDNGGYMIEFNQKVVKLGDTDIVLKDSYVDRNDGNVTKEFKSDSINSFTFAFQESVGLMDLKERMIWDMRILVIHKSPKDKSFFTGTAEESCLCNPDTFACTAVFSIRDPTRWTTDKTIFAHEIGHSLGMDPHDNEFYTDNPDHLLLMWSAIGPDAYIWSPEAKRRINHHDKSCLATVEKSF